MMYFNYICIMDVRFTNASTPFEGYTNPSRDCFWEEELREGEMGYEGGEWFSGKILCHFLKSVLWKDIIYSINVHMAENKASSLWKVKNF